MSLDRSLLETFLGGRVQRKRKTSAPIRPSIYQTRAKAYDRLMCVLRYAQTRQAILKKFLPALPCRAAILEVGCGTGICTDALREIYPDADIRGLDQSPEMLSIFRQRHPTVPALAGDFNHPYLLDSHSLLKPASYDLILSAGVLSEYGRYEAYASVAGLLKRARSLSHHRNSTQCNWLADRSGMGISPLRSSRHHEHLSDRRII